MPSPPLHPLAAVTHPDPAAYYTSLAARPLYHDATLGCWVAASAEAATAVLTSPLCRVRPVGEPVPSALLGSPAELIFRHLARMNDGALHCPFKRAVEDVFGGLPMARVWAESRRWAEFLCRLEHRALADGDIGEFALDLPVYVLGRLLGIPPEHLPTLTRLMRDFAPCLSPASLYEHVERGKVAAGALLEMFSGLLCAPLTGGSLLSVLADEARRHGCDDPAVVIANGIGFVWQSYEATAGLIGNTLLALARNPELRMRAGAERGRLRDIMLEVLRLDPPIQNTRRFVAEDGVLLGREVRAGDVILVVLAAANVDAAVNPNSEHVRVTRNGRPLFTFGVGPHACPGQSVALTIAGVGVAQCLTDGLDLAQFASRIVYRPSVNARVLVWPHEGRV